MAETRTEICKECKKEVKVSNKFRANSNGYTCDNCRPKVDFKVKCSLCHYEGVIKAKTVKDAESRICPKCEMKRRLQVV
jgi:hypothetical protein